MAKIGRRKRRKPRPAPGGRRTTRRDEEQAKREAEGRSGGAKNRPIDPRPRTRKRTTDAEAKVMKQSTRDSIILQRSSVVDNAEQIIVAAETTNEANDKQQACRWPAALDNLNAAGIENRKRRTGRQPIPNTADTGYFSKEAVEELENGHGPAHRHRRQKHHEAPVRRGGEPSAEAAAPSAEARAKERCSANCVRRR